MKVYKLISVMMGILIALTLAAGNYLVREPQRDSERVLRLLSQVQVGGTSVQQLTKLIEAEYHGRNQFSCGLDSQPQFKKIGENWTNLDPKMPPAPPYTLGWRAMPGTRRCTYTFSVTSPLFYKLGLAGASKRPIANVLLYRLRLAPPAVFIADIAVNDSVVVGAGFHAEILAPERESYAAYIDAEQINVPPGCGQDICAERINITPPGFAGVRIQVSPSARLPERNRIFALNTKCLSKIGGCKSAYDLLPISELREPQAKTASD